MANVYAVKSGNWSDTTVWNTGALPTSADTAFANTYTVTIDVTTTVLAVSNLNATGISAGGGFSFANGSNLTCTNTITTVGNNATLFTFSLASPAAATLNANISASNAPAVVYISHSGSGTLSIVGNIGYTYFSGAGRVILNGSSGTVNITGSVFGLNAFNAISYALLNSSTGTINVNGLVYSAGGGSQSGSCGIIANTSTGTINITGNCTLQHTVISQFIYNSGSGTINITGQVTNQVSDNYAVANTSNGTLSIIGSIISQSTLAALAPGSITQLTYLSGPFIGTPQGIASNAAVRWRWTSSIGSSYMTVPNSTATGYKNLYTADSVGGNPAVNNVRSGTVYGPSSELTGTCAVPAAGSVALGVPVDNTTGTAVLTQANVRTALGMASANLDTQLDALPTAAETATAVRTELTPELSRISNTSTTQEVADIVEGAFNT